MHHLQLSYILFVFGLSFQAFGYQIDVSCTTKEVENDIRNAMTSAFEMIDAAARRLTEDPMDANTLELVGPLFAKPDQDPRQVPMRKTIQVLDRMRESYRTEVASGQALDENDIAIFCNHDRYVLEDAKTKTYKDTKSGAFLHFDEQLCRGTWRDIDEKIALAVTFNPVLDQGVYRNGIPLVLERATQIQLCPWFIDWIKEKEYNLHNDVKRSNVGRAVIKLSDLTKYGFAQIDAFSLLDKVLLHEMTHGRTAYSSKDGDSQYTQIGLLDVPVLKGWNTWPLLRFPSYGWKRAKKLAVDGDQTGTLAENAPDNNADTVALFASVCKLMDDPDKPRKVDEEGRIVPLN